MMQNIILSIVTPSYNRRELLQRCFESLQRQTDKRFEWIVVDDGSTDDTESAVISCQAEARGFPVYYLKKKNGGKHTALNASHSLLHGKYVLMLDSDDTLTEDAVSLVLEAWAFWDTHPEVGIVTFLKGSDLEHPHCYAADENCPVDIISYPRICPVSQDACEVIRTELFRKFPFPVFPGEHFLSEGVLWNRVGLTHKCVYINRVIYLCEYLEGGLTRSGRAMRIRNPRGGMCSAHLNMSKRNRLKSRIKNAILFTCYGCFAGMKPSQMAAACDHKSLMWLCLPFGFFLFLYWKHRYER